MFRRSFLSLAGASAACRALAQQPAGRSLHRGMQTYPSGTAGAEGVLVYGQSNAGCGGADIATYLSADFPGSAVTLQFGYEQSFNIPINPLTTGGMADLHNPKANLLDQPFTVAVSAAFALQQFQADASQVAPVRWWYTEWVGGAPITTFVQGTIAYNNLMIIAHRIANVGAFFNPPPLPIKAVVYIQGETPTSGYAAALTALIGTLVPDVQAQTGQATPPEIILVQTNNASNVGTPIQVRLDQLTVSQTVAGTFMAGPEYYTPYQNQGPTGNIHGTQEGRMMVGEVIAYAYKKQIIDGVTWNPLQPASASRLGAVITVQFQLPPGGGNLALDTSWILAATNYGFVYQDDTSSATILSVSLGGDGTSVVITLDGVPTGANKKILYAMGQVADLSVTWPGARGQLISPTTQTSYFWRQGQAVPQFVNHYSVSFSQAVT